MMALFRRLFGREKKAKGLAGLPPDVLRHIAAESNHLAAAIDATEGLLSDDDTERLKQLTKSLEDFNKQH